MTRRTIILALALVASALTIWTVITDSTDIRAEETQEPRPRALDRSTFPVTVRYPSPSPGIATGIVDVNGRSVTVSCEVCHSLRTAPPPPEALGLASLKDFHRGLVFEHGSLTCLSCHDPSDAQSFRLADGTPVDRWDIVDLCAQCHGPQRRDFDHGAHGGMTGYWDLSRGPRTRNACTGCHSAHAPQSAQVRPTFKPIDRFLVGSEPDDSNRTEVRDHE